MARYVVALAFVGVLLVSSAAAQSTSATTYCAGTTSNPRVSYNMGNVITKKRKFKRAAVKGQIFLDVVAKSMLVIDLKLYFRDAQVLRATVKVVPWDAVEQE